MARVRSTAPSVALFPFLSILVCLIGTIVVLICVLSIIQATHMGGRPRKEVELAMEYVAAQKKIKQHETRLKEIQAEIDKDAEAKKRREELEQRIVQLNLRLAAAKDSEKTSRELQRELELATVQLAEMAKERPPITEDVDRLKKELAVRKIDPKKLVPQVVVQPGGSGIAEGGNLFFIEATGGALTLYKTQTETARITAGSIGTDKEYDAFLQKVAATPNSTLIFLIRDDGWHSYVRGAGGAEGSFNVKTAKLPMPSKGAIDLGQFERFMAK
jgi:hypothetical protein